MTKKGNIAFITAPDLSRLLDLFAESADVYAPDAVEECNGTESYSYSLRKAGQMYRFFGYRPSHPLKTFLFEGRMKVADYPVKDGEGTPSPGKPVTVVGCASCDIESLKSLDAVFLQDSFTDTFYRERRESALLVSADCTEPRETCLCTRSATKPYPTEGFDLNLSKVNSGYVIEAGSDKGTAVMEKNASLFKEATRAMLDERDRIREETVQRVNEINSDYALSQPRRELLGKMRESDQWYEHVSACVDCGACLFSCPTCHCFLLSDHTKADGDYSRYKAWDSCSYAGYSRMAGGSSPRLGLMERFRHRYLHKFEYYPINFGFEACSGCGRCIEGCMGNIDMRKVFTALDTEQQGAQTR